MYATKTIILQVTLLNEFVHIKFSFKLYFFLVTDKWQLKVFFSLQEVFMDLIEETKRVNYHSATAHYADGVNSIVTRYEAEVFFKHMNKDGSVLELGPAEGVMTDILFPYFSDYTVVDGASFFVDDLKRRYPTIKGYACLFEEISTEKNTTI